VSSSNGEDGSVALPGGAVSGARKRAAVETYARHEEALRRTARRYSLCADDADDALQRALEILLTKAPSEDRRELIRWTQTVVKHEALAVRRERERILSGPAAATPEPGREDWTALIPSAADGPPERAERQEAVARGREALQSLKPQELRALTLLAEGYSYAEIGEITGFSRTKINRCLAEGRERFRSVLSRSRDGSRCVEMGPALSAFCDGEIGAGEVATLREHLRVCASCRATLRTYRAAPQAAAALAPALPLARSLLDRAQEALSGLAARFGGGGGAAADSALSQVAATGGGAGMAALAKAAAICVGTAGGAAACVATGVIPAPLELGQRQAQAPAIERTVDPALRTAWKGQNAVEYEPAAEPSPTPAPVRPEPQPAVEPPSAPAAEPEPVSGAVEYSEPEAEAAPATAATTAGAGGESGSPAGEFGP